MSRSVPTALYNLRMLGQNHYAMAKFDTDFNVSAVYNIKDGHCDCPASQRAVKLKPCKHQRMLKFMLGAVNTERFYDPETGTWHEPLALMRNGDEDGLEKGYLHSNGASPQPPAEPPQPPAGVGATPAPPMEVRSSPPPSATPIITRRI